MANKVAVVILNYNGRNYLEQFLPNVLENSSPYQVIVADNASTDDSVHFLESQFPEIQLIKIPENLGYAGGYNYALKYVEAEYYVLLNSDVETTKSWIEPVVELMDENTEIAACQPKIRSFHNKKYFEYAGAAGGYIDFLGYPFCRGRIFSTLEKDQGQYDDNRSVFWATGACLFVRAKDFHELGELDAEFFAHMEEIDFCWRAKNRGKQIYYCGKSTVYHVGGGTLNTESPFKTYLNFRNNWLLLYKNLSQKEFAKIKFKRTILDYIAFIQLTVVGKYSNAKSISKAHRDFRKMSKKYSQNEKEGFTHPEVFSRSIIRAYFLKGFKSFTKLKFTL